MLPEWWSFERTGWYDWWWRSVRYFQLRWGSIRTFVEDDIRSYLDPRTPHTTLWCQLNTFSLTQINPLPSYSLKSHCIISFSALQHTAIRKVTWNAFMGKELFLLCPKILTSAWSSQQMWWSQQKRHVLAPYFSVPITTPKLLQKYSKGTKGLEKLSSF